jgi:hypothetical protein
VLRNSTGLACRYIAAADGIQQTSLAVIHMAHDRYNRRPRLASTGSFGSFWRFFHLGLELHIQAQLAHDYLGGVEVDLFVDSNGNAVLKQLGNQLIGWQHEELG